MNTKLEKEIQSYFANVPIRNLRDITNVAMDFYEKGVQDSALIPEDIGVIFNLVRQLQIKYSDTAGCYEEALKLFNKGRELK